MKNKKEVSVYFLVLWGSTYCAYALFDPTVNCTAIKDTCKPCAEGQFADKGNPYCDCCDTGSCPRHHHNVSYCTDCHPGTYMNSTNATQCIQCPPGKVAPHKAAVECTPCQPGYEQSNKGQSKCDACSIGTHCNVTECKKCEDCSAGHEARQEAAVNCTPCQPGTYKTKQGSLLCRTCPHGYYTTKTGSTQCTLCPKLYYCPLPDEGPQKCSTKAICPPGSTAPQYCWAPWYYTPDNLHCILSRDFKVIVAAVSIAFVLLVVIVAVCCVYEKRCSRMKKSMESEPLVKPREDGKKDPVYTGL